jgi:hypothetical protein
MPLQTRSGGHTLFAQYAYPPNELGYCGPSGPADVDGLADLGTHAREFDGAWPYLAAIADDVGIGDPLDGEVVRNYWVGGALLERVDAGALLTRLRAAFVGQVTGLLDDIAPGAKVLAHHSFHVFVVYPWTRFLDQNPATPVQVMQSCRIRWGTVESVTADDAVISSRPLTFAAGDLGLGPARTERVRWRRDGMSLTSAPTPGDTVSAHWDWICGTLTADESAALDVATRATLDVVNTARRTRASPHP